MPGRLGLPSIKNCGRKNDLTYPIRSGEYATCVYKVKFLAAMYGKPSMGMDTSTGQKSKNAQQLIKQKGLNTPEVNN